MKKRIVKLIISAAALTVIFLSCIMAAASGTDEAAEAVRTNQSLYINEKSVTMQGYNINGNNYFKLRDLAKCLNNTSSQFDVAWNAEENAVEIYVGEPYSGDNTSSSVNSKAAAYKTDAVLLVDGKKVDAAAYNIEYNNYYMLRDLSGILGFEIKWLEAENRINIYINNENSQITERTGTNVSRGYLIDERCASTVKSLINDNGDGTISAVSVDDSVHIDTYDADTLELLYSNEVDMELDIFGGVYFGSEYNFIVFGQMNSEEDDDKVTFKTVKYSKDWDYIDCADYKKNNTETPFRSGTLSMTEYKGYLYVRTCHTMYTSSDGKNHQANITYSVNINSMKIIDSFSKVMNISYGYCSHSFSQFIAVDDGKLIGLDLGDAYPRSVVIGQYENSLKSGKFINNGSYNSINLLNIPGDTGANCTGVAIGGFEISSENYIVAISKIDFSKADSFSSSKISGTDTDQRDVVLLISDKDNTKTKNVKQVQLTDYSGNNMTCSSPYIVAAGDDTYAVLWNEYDLSVNTECLRYVLVNEDGKKLSAVETLDAELGCQPIYSNGDIIWCVDKKYVRYFYSIDLDSVKK